MDLEKFGFRKDFSFENRFDLKTQVGRYEVSTVDLGMNHQFMPDLPPLYYETMIFVKADTCEERHKDNPFEYYQERYTTEKQARKGHKKAIKLVKEKIGNK